MLRRDVLCSVGALLSLAGCASDGGNQESTPESTESSQTNTPEATEVPEETSEDLLSYLFTADGLGDHWSKEEQKAGQQSSMAYAERLFQNAETGRYLFVGLRAQDSIALAKQATSSARSQFEGGDELSSQIGDEAYQAYPEESATGVQFETGVLFRKNRYVGLVALAENNPTRKEVIALGQSLAAELS